MIQRTINNVIDTFYNVIEYPEYITSVMVGPSEDQSKNGKICVKVTVSDISQTDNETKDIDEIIGLLPSSFISNGVSYDVEKLVYSRQKCIHVLMRDNDMNYEEANEYFDFNVAGSYMGDKTPIWVDDTMFEWE